MSTSYEAAKRVALGLETERKETPGEDLWNISLDGGFGLAAEMPYQYFEKGFEPPDEQVAQKAALMLLYDDEYAADRAAAEQRLQKLRDALAADDSAAVTSLLSASPPDQWLSLIFLDGTQIREELAPLLEGASPTCRSAFSAAAERSLKRLVEFKDLLETLNKLC